MKEKYFLFYYIIISAIIILSNSNINEEDLDESIYTYITLKINKGNNLAILNSNFRNPNIVYINGNKQEMPQSTYTFEDSDDNTVILIWTKPIKDCNAMFKYCNKIIEMDLSHFDTSQVSDMLSMFEGCTNLKYLNISNIDTSNVQNMGIMFGGCSSLESIDLSHFDTSSNINIGTMFMGCSSLKSIDLSNFNTSKINYMDNLFNGCTSLTSFNLSSFDTSHVTHMYSMFKDCISLTSINISNFNTKNIHKFENMFDGCTSLISLDFQNMDLSSAESMNNMFDNCNNLEYVNIKNFIPKDNNNQNNIFNGCPKNIAICINDDSLIDKIKNNECNTFGCSDNWKESKNKITENGVCTQDCESTDYKFEYKFRCYSSCLDGTYNNNYMCENCHKDCKKCDGNYTIDNTNCLSCSSESKYLYFGNCIDECPRKSFYYNETMEQNICKCELSQCKTCSINSLNENLCTSCDIEEGYFPIYDDLYIKILPFYNCYKSLEGYYLDNEYSAYKLCYKSCKTCDKPGDDIENNCLECKYDYRFEIHYDKYKNCFDNCRNYHYFNENENISYCANNSECPINYSKLIEDNGECISSCEKDNIYKYEFKSKCYKDCPSNSIKRENNDDLSYLSLNKIYFCKPICNEITPFEIILTQECVENCDYKEIKNKSCILNYKNYNTEDNKTEKIYDDLLKNVEDEFTSDDYDTTNLENGNYDIIELDKIKITLTTTQNQKNEEKNINVTTIDLNECEQLLKVIYHIPQEEILYMKKIDVIQEGMQIPKIEYEVYTKYNRSNLLKLNLSICNDIKIDISIPIKLTENIDKYNPSSKYYNDICYTATSDSGTDITMKDRKEEFINNNKTLCQDECTFSEYNYITQKAKCLCDVVESSSSFSNMKINKLGLYKNFIDIKNIININILVCYKVLFTKKGILNNYGCFSLMAVIILHFIIIIIFYAKHLINKIRIKIKDISFGIQNFYLLQEENNRKEYIKKINIKSYNQKPKKNASKSRGKFRNKNIMKQISKIN